jgi:hypothetical protein
MGCHSRCCPTSLVGNLLQPLISTALLTESNGSSIGSSNVVGSGRATTSSPPITLPSSSLHSFGGGLLRVMSPHHRLGRDDGPFFFSCPGRKQHECGEPAPFYFAWGCFRVLCLGSECRRRGAAAGFGESEFGSGSEGEATGLIVSRTRCSASSAVHRRAGTHDGPRNSSASLRAAQHPGNAVHHINKSIKCGISGMSAGGIG